MHWDTEKEPGCEILLMSQFTFGFPRPAQYELAGHGVEQFAFPTPYIPLALQLQSDKELEPVTELLFVGHCEAVLLLQ